ncbi:MAG: class II aldolase/adducin family protein [Myxococcales bacterium]|nr:class II aldolase/adducin family protein [Myxococcales bacterium]
MSGPDERRARIELCELAKDIWQRGLGAAGDGNLSVRVGHNRILTTPSACHKGRLQPSDIVAVDLSGAPLGSGRPSSEITLHTAAYRARDDIGAVIHAHPPMATAYQLAGGQLSDVFVSEVIFAFGQVATAPYTTPTTADVAATLGPYLSCYDVIMMPRHGSVTLGKDLMQAFLRLDALEHSARVNATAQLLAPRFGQSLAPVPAAELQRLYTAAGMPDGAPPTGASCPPMEGARPTSLAQQDERLVAAVLHALKGTV